MKGKHCAFSPLFVDKTLADKIGDHIPLLKNLLLRDVKQNQCDI